jgi:hypothetical protein
MSTKKNCSGGEIISKEKAKLLMSAYKSFLDGISNGRTIGLLDLSKQPKYLKLSRAAIEDILKDDECGGLGIALALTNETTGKPQFTLVVGPLKGDDCKMNLDDIKIYEDLGQGDTIDPGETDLQNKFSNFLHAVK